MDDLSESEVGAAKAALRQRFERMRSQPDCTTYLRGAMKCGHEHARRLVEHLVEQQFFDEDRDRVQKALAIASYYSGTSERQKAWVIDQMVRALAGDRYDQVVQDACDGSDGSATHSWDCGVEPQQRLRIVSVGRA